jgi:hypothetical protein
MILLLSRNMPTGIINRPRIRNPGRIIYMYKPRFEFPLSNIVEITKRRRISKRFIAAIIEPMIVSQFFDEGGNFIVEVLNNQVR